MIKLGGDYTATSFLGALLIGLVRSSLPWLYNNWPQCGYPAIWLVIFNSLWSKKPCHVKLYRLLDNSPVDQVKQLIITKLTIQLNYVHTSSQLEVLWCRTLGYVFQHTSNQSNIHHALWIQLWCVLIRLIPILVYSTCLQ